MKKIKYSPRKSTPEKKCAEDLLELTRSQIETALLLDGSTNAYEIMQLIESMIDAKIKIATEGLSEQAHRIKLEHLEWFNALADDPYVMDGSHFLRFFWVDDYRNLWFEGSTIVTRIGGNEGLEVTFADELGSEGFLVGKIVGSGEMIVLEELQ